LEERIIPVIQGHGIDLWYSKSDIKASGLWEREIIQGLQSCDWFLVVMSPRSATSEWVKDEISWAFTNRVGRIIPLLIEDCDPISFHLRLPRIQQIDFRAADAPQRLLALWKRELKRDDVKSAPPVNSAPASANGLTSTSTQSERICSNCSTRMNVPDYCQRCGTIVWKEMLWGFVSGFGLAGLGLFLMLWSYKFQWIVINWTVLALGGFLFFLGAICLIVFICYLYDAMRLKSGWQRKG